MSASNFDDKEIAEHLRQSKSKRQNADYDPERLTRELKVLAERGDETSFEAKLRTAGIARG